MEDLEFELDYSTYMFEKKNVIDLNKVVKLDKPKLNRNNRIFTDENISKITYESDDKFIMTNNNIQNGKNSNNTEFKNSRSIHK